MRTFSPFKFNNPPKKTHRVDKVSKIVLNIMHDKSSVEQLQQQQTTMAQHQVVNNTKTTALCK